MIWQGGKVIHVSAPTGIAATDTAAIQAAFDAVPEAGATVQFSAGTWLIDSVHYDGLGPVRIIGAAAGTLGDTVNLGTVLEANASSATMINIPTTARNMPVSIEYLTLFGASKNDLIGIASNRWQCTFDNVHLNMFNGTGTCVGFDINGSAGVTTTTNTIVRCRTRKCTTAVRTDYSTALTLKNSYFAAGTTGVDASGGTDDTIYVTGCAFDSFTQAISTNSPSNRIIGNRFEGNTNGILLGAAAHNSITSFNYLLGTGAGTAISITSGNLNAQVFGNTYSNWATKISNSGTTPTILDNLPVIYDSTTSTTTSIATLSEFKSVKCNTYFALDYIATVNLTSSQNNYAGSAGSWWLVNPDGDYSITGITGGVEGRFIYMTFMDQVTTLSNQSSSSSVSNRIITSIDSDLKIGPNGSATLIYDSGNQKWRVIAYTNAITDDDVVTTNVISNSENNKTFWLDNASGFPSTLPPLQLGLSYRFVVKTAPSGGNYTIGTSGGSNVIQTRGLWVNAAYLSASDQDVITFANGAAVAGDWVLLECDGVGWYASGYGGAAGSITTGAT